MPISAYFFRAVHFAPHLKMGESWGMDHDSRPCSAKQEN
ncbi:hypothetical protein D1BOALGB6SA_7918 [Olavius sp. associated proteobacterium Delta 1]|nr:hypothetical protein D1BOALGB6SA_7918 [Olavius sp. associated proteobacterium Delta 1]